ncbi:MAG: hypothetical protein OHK0046_07240 [Anaerolineae bacterium]
MEAITLKIVLLLHMASTLLMVGIIWFIQIVHYPLFSRVGVEDFRVYEYHHTALITLVVMPLMLVELGTALLLVVLPPPGVSPLLTWAGLGLVIMIWVSTALLQVPQHAQLATGFDSEIHRALVASNWIRTIAWSLRGALVLAIVGRFVHTGI